MFGSALTDRMMCVARTKKPIASACNGDSGGGLLIQNSDYLEAVGVVSWGVSGCEENKPSVMARITSSLTWILKKTKDSNYCPRLGVD